MKGSILYTYITTPEVFATLTVNRILWLARYWPISSYKVTVGKNNCNRTVTWGRTVYRPIEIRLKRGVGFFGGLDSA